MNCKLVFHPKNWGVNMLAPLYLIIRAEGRSFLSHRLVKFSIGEFILQVFGPSQGNCYSFNLCSCIIDTVTGLLENSFDFLSAEAGRMINQINKKSIIVVVAYHHWNCGGRLGLLKRCGRFNNQFCE